MRHVHRAPRCLRSRSWPSVFVVKPTRNTGFESASQALDAQWWHNGRREMPSHDGTDPALLNTPVPLEGDGTELLGMVVDNRYRLDSPLGRGGMGLVYRA